MKTYNINELLEKKKELETQITEVLGELNSKELTYEKQTFIDLVNKTEKEFEIKKKQDLTQFSQKYLGLVDELAKIKTAISKFNADNVAELLYKREKARTTLQYLKKIKETLPKNKNVGTKVHRQNSEGVALEVVDYEIVPLFNIEAVEKRLNETAAEERKVNTEIQKINLNATIDLE